MNKVFILLITVAMVLVLFPATGTAGDVSVRFKISYLEFDRDYNSYKLLVNISTSTPGHVVYLEEYYTLDSNSNPKFVSSKRTDGGDLIKVNSSYNASFEILRPVPHGGKTYTLVKAVILLDENRIFEYWLTKNNDFVDNTGSGDDDTLLTRIQNVDRHETKEMRLIAGSPITFEYPSLGVVYQINVTGRASGYVDLRIELLKGRPGNTDKPRGIAYQYIDISEDSNRVGEVALKYRVERSWMENRNITERYVGMLSWNGTGKVWELLPTKVIDNDSKYTYYESVAPGLSSFVIVGVPTKAPLKTNSTASKTIKAGGKADLLNQTDIDGIKNREIPLKSIFGFGFILAMAAFLFIMRRARKEKTGGTKNENI